MFLKHFRIGVFKVFRLSFQILSKALQTQALAAPGQISSSNNHTTSLVFHILHDFYILHLAFCIFSNIWINFRLSILHPNQQGPNHTPSFSKVISQLVTDVDFYRGIATRRRHLKAHKFLQESDKSQIFYWSSQTCSRIRQLIDQWMDC